ncbi:hypothetical protein DSO57_1020753 [Entomophthora muscae]|uniref:Uncharacterized protein n=1 Tax=Entomophthora muscae TaxID=34485 RepID=A0ACC2S639_9FUNG|nr:hypothetical protein DSO57_1020753 [Entomophthora muscae]
MPTTLAARIPKRGQEMVHQKTLISPPLNYPTSKTNATASNKSPPNASPSRHQDSKSTFPNFLIKALHLILSYNTSLELPHNQAPVLFLLPTTLLNPPAQQIPQFKNKLYQKDLPTLNPKDLITSLNQSLL